jgi:hypothetical protein
LLSWELVLSDAAGIGSHSMHLFELELTRWRIRRRQAAVTGLEFHEPPPRTEGERLIERLLFTRENELRPELVTEARLCMSVLDSLKRGVMGVA